MQSLNLLELIDGMDFNQSHDHYMQSYTSPQAYAWHYVNATLDMNWLAYDGGHDGPLNEEGMAECLVDIHNDCVDRLNQGISPVRHWAVLDDVRLRLRGLLTPDATLVAWTGLQPLPERPQVFLTETRPLMTRRRVIPSKADPVSC